MRKRLIILIIFVMILGVASFGIFRYMRGEMEKVTAEEWIVKKYELVDQFNTFSSGLDDVMSMYSLGSISVEDLANEVYMAQSQLAIMKRLYDQDLEEHPIKTGSHTYETKKGMEGLETIWSSYENMLELLAEVCVTSGSANDAAYVYLAYREPVTSGLFDYMQAYYSVTDPSRMLDAEELLGELKETNAVTAEETAGATEEAVPEAAESSSGTVSSNAAPTEENVPDSTVLTEQAGIENGFDTSGAE